MWLKRLMSRNCCGGSVLILSLLCLGMGLLFVSLSATAPGLVFIGVGCMVEGFCLLLGRSRWRNRFVRQHITG